MAGGSGACEGASLAAVGMLAEPAPFAAAILADLLRRNENRRRRARFHLDAAASCNEGRVGTTIAGRTVCAVVAAWVSANESTIRAAPEAPHAAGVSAESGLAPCVRRFALLEGIHARRAVGAFAFAASDRHAGVTVPVPARWPVASDVRALDLRRSLGATADGSGSRVKACV